MIIKNSKLLTKLVTGRCSHLLLSLGLIFSSPSFLFAQNPVLEKLFEEGTNDLKDIFSSLQTFLTVIALVLFAVCGVLAGIKFYQGDREAGERLLKLIGGVLIVFIILTVVNQVLMTIV